MSPAYTALLDKSKLLAERDALREQLRAAQSVCAAALRSIQSHENDKRLAVKALLEAEACLLAEQDWSGELPGLSEVRAALLLLEGDK